MRNFFAERLKELREEKEISQNQLSKLIGVTSRCVSSWEAGKSQPTKDNIIALAKFFGCTSDYLIGLTDT